MFGGGSLGIVLNGSLSERRSKGKKRGISGSRKRARGRREEGKACNDAIVLFEPPPNQNDDTITVKCLAAGAGCQTTSNQESFIRRPKQAVLETENR